MADAVTIRTPDSMPSKVDYALGELADALALRDRSLDRTDRADADVVVGTPATSTGIAALVESGRLDLLDSPEALAIQRVDDTTYVAGADDQGLMYALLELAEVLRYDDVELAAVPAVSEAPDTAERRIYTFLTNDDLAEEWFYSEQYWRDYFDLLAKSRFNAFQLLPGGHMIPVYRYFVAVPEHPEVAPDAITEADRKRNLEMLRYVSELAQERGIDFVLGVWQVIVWADYFVGAPDESESLVEGLDWSNLESYTYHGLKRLLEACPAIEGVQLRVNFEAGIPRAEQTEFCRRSLFRAVDDLDHEVFLDLRGWMTRHETIAAAEALGIPLRLSMKYWAEFMGGPYQPADHWPGYSYADFYKQPVDAPRFQQVWSMGSHRLFVWGDPTYVSTFAESLELGDNVGFEVAPPLALKGFGNDPGVWRVLDAEYEHYEWEFERYWLFYRLYGRLTFDADASEAVWMRHLRARFGENADAVMAAYEAASKVVTFLVRFNMSDPNLFTSPEVDIGGVLDFYQDVQPSDPARIKSFGEAAAEERTGEFTARLHPDEASDYLRAVGETCLAAAEELASAAEATPELQATLVDVESLGELALYHAEKTLAAAELSRFYETGDLGALLGSREHLTDATPHWERLAEVAGEMYHEAFVNGPIDNLTWDDKRPFVAEDVKRLTEQCALHRRYGSFVRGFDFGGTHGFSTDELFRYLNRTWEGERPWLHDFTVERGFTGVDETCVKDRLSEYGWEATDELTSVTAPLVRIADKHNDDRYRVENLTPTWADSVAYGEQLTVDYVAGTAPATFVTTLEPGTYEVTVVLADRSESPTDHGPMSVTLDGAELATERTVPAGEVVELKSVVELDTDELRVAFAADGGDWIASGLVVRPLAPVIAHAPPRAVPADGVLSASVTCPDELEAVVLCLREADGAVRRLEMAATPAPPRYAAAVPSESLASTGPLTYWFEARSSTSRTARLPDATAAMSSFERWPATADAGPTIRTQPVTRSAPLDAPVRIEATVESERPLAAVRLHYRHANQYATFRTVTMDVVSDEADTDGFAAEIPADYLDPAWDVVYYLEAVDVAGRGAFWPAPEPAENPVSGIPYQVIEVEP